MLADRNGMAASRFLAAAAARGILLWLASENRKSYCSSCMRVANGALAADFFVHFGASCVAASLCKSLLCAKASVCKSLSVQKLAL